MVDEGEEVGRGWRTLWLSSLQSFADAETQRIKWIDPANRNPAYSFVEYWCSYFDDALRGEEYEHFVSLGYLSRTEADAVAGFHLAAGEYVAPNGNDYDHHTILADPAWQAVVAAAQIAQQRLRRLLIKEREIRLLTLPVQWKENGGEFQSEETQEAIGPLSTFKMRWTL